MSPTVFEQKQKKLANPLIKLVNNQLNTMSVNFKWGTSVDALCPLCGCYGENTSHILQCSHTLMQEERNKSLDEFMKKLKEVQTETNILTLLRDILVNHAVGLPIVAPKLSVEPIQMNLRKIFFSIKNVGWVNFQKGFLQLQFSRKFQLD